MNNREITDNLFNISVDGNNVFYTKYPYHYGVSIEVGNFTYSEKVLGFIFIN